MRITTTIQGIQQWRRGRSRQQGTIGLVPTMGALHPGHHALIQLARKSCDLVVVSLFVNPLQFGPTEDYTRYPRTLKEDIALCRREDVDVIFSPSLQEFYPHGFQTFITLSHLAKRWEGEWRPTHFQGVATVVTKLLHLVKPDFAIFGQKDYQQTLVVKQLVRDLNMQVKIIMCPTVREPDGLPYSSRNQYLSSAQREKAVFLYEALRAGKEAIRNGMRSAAAIQEVMKKRMRKDRQVILEYLAICDAFTLEPLVQTMGKMVLLGAIRLGKVRLIDNLLVQQATRGSFKP